MYISLNNIKIYYEKYGTKKEKMLILPGWGNTKETFRNIINTFQDQYTIYIVDYPGLGNSPIPNRTLTIYDYTELIIDLMNALNIKDPIIIAHSFGGRIATLLTSYYKCPISKMIFIDVAGIKPRKTLKRFIKEKIYKLLRKCLKLLPVIKREYYHQLLLKRFASADYNNLHPNMRQTFKNIVNTDLLKYYEKIPSEVLLLWGELDKDTPLKDAIKINKRIKNSALIVLKKATHYSYLQYPLLVNNIIKEFVK